MIAIDETYLDSDRQNVQYTSESLYTKCIWKDCERRERVSKRSKGDSEEKKRRNETKERHRVRKF